MAVETTVDGIQPTRLGKRVVTTCKTSWNSHWYLFSGLGLIVGGIIIGWAIASPVDPQSHPLNGGISLFALLFIMAQALERFMEPFTEFWWVSEESTNDEPKSDAEIEKEATTRLWKRKVIYWGITSSLAMLCSAYMGVFLLRMIGAEWTPLWIDIAITGLAVGAGTKPLHDLIQRIEAGKQG